MDRQGATSLSRCSIDRVDIILQNHRADEKRNRNFCLGGYVQRGISSLLSLLGGSE